MPSRATKAIARSTKPPEEPGISANVPAGETEKLAAGDETLAAGFGDVHDAKELGD